MIIEYNDEADALYIAFEHVGASAPKKQRELDDRRIVDLDEDGEPIGVEFLDYSEGIDLEGVPRAEEIAQALIALLAPRQAVLASLEI
jgi:uncharacterized protein YuzE